ncbi:hypothetical protein GCM10010254_65840 [Streptomyces chromofuscus]|nr:hypothetical protein GCM10010254_65840 [Streptomyces chromofuscus]
MRSRLARGVAGAVSAALVTTALLDDVFGITGVRLTSGGTVRGPARGPGIAVTISRAVTAVTLPFI